MKHPRKLREEVDYYVLNKFASVKTPDGLRTTPKIWKIWLVEANEEQFICPTCFQYTAPRVRQVFGHLARHSRVSTPRHDIYRQAAAFRLLPVKIQKLMMTRLDEQGETEDDGHDS